MHISFKIIKFYFTLRCSTCFGHHCVYHQELPSTAHAASGHRVMWFRLRTVTRGCMCSRGKLLMMDTVVSETC
jgi:hypothetical protein